MLITSLFPAQRLPQRRSTINERHTNGCVDSVMGEPANARVNMRSKPQGPQRQGTLFQCRVAFILTLFYLLTAQDQGILWRTIFTA